MKKFALFFAFSMLGYYSVAQTNRLTVETQPTKFGLLQQDNAMNKQIWKTSVQPHPIPATISDCKGNTARPNDLLEKSYIFNQVGINLTRYDWSNPTVNCHINETIRQTKAAAGKRILANGLLGLGLGFISTALLTDGYVEIRRAALGLGVISTGGSIALYRSSSKSKKQANVHLDQVGSYFRNNKLY